MCTLINELRYIIYCLSNFPQRFFFSQPTKKKDVHRKQNASLTKERFYGHGTYYKKHNAPLIPHYWLSVKKGEI